jgi:threonine dehydratase
MVIVTPADIEKAHARLDGLAWRTPMLASPALSQVFGVPVGLKAENLQRTGSFKLRGASNALANLPPARLEQGIVAASAGNHALAVARAAANAGVKATVCMPATCPLAKLEPVRALGAEVRLIEGAYEDADESARSLADSDGRPLIHPFADPDVVAGQGTVGLEIAGDAPDTRLIVVPMGGGGLVSGIAIAAKERLDGVRVVAVQAAERSRTIADGIAVKRPLGLTSKLVDDYVDDVVAVSDDEIAQAMVHLIERSKLVVEGAGAAAAAAVLCDRVEPPASGSACVVLSGGNVDASLLAECIRMGETAAGRRAVLKTVLPDQPGALDALLRIVADHGANIIDVAHLREGVDLHVRETLIRLVIQTTGRDHALEVADALRGGDFDVDIEH